MRPADAIDNRSQLLVHREVAVFDDFHEQNRRLERAVEHHWTVAQLHEPIMHQRAARAAIENARRRLAYYLRGRWSPSDYLILAVTGDQIKTRL
jgi:hypothetical protein